MSPPSSPLARLGAFAFRRRRLVVAVWLVSLVAAFGASSQLGGDWKVDYATPGSESKAAADLLADRFPGRTPDSVDVVWQARDASAPAVEQRIDAFVARAERLEGIGDRPGATQVSRDGTIGLARLPLTTDNPFAVPEETGTRLIDLAEATAGDGLRVELGGRVIEQAEQGEISSEAIGLMVALGVLLLTFGTVVAAGLPIATALFGLGISSAIGVMLAAVIDTPDWAPSVAMMIGLGVGIDYALLILTRYRTALAGGSAPLAATAEAISTAGRSVLIAGTTVVISLMGLFLMGFSFFNATAIGSILAVLIVLAASLTLLPAMLGFLGTRVNRLRIPGTGRSSPDPERGVAARWSGVIQRRPWTAALAGVVVLLALATPVTDLRLGFPDAGNNREGTTTRAAYDLTAKGFGAGTAGPLMLAVELADDSERGALGSLAQRLRDEPDVAAVEGPALNPAGDTGLINVIPRSAPQEEATEDLLQRIRDEVVPASGLNVSVGGSTPSFVDQGEATAERLPLLIGGVVGLSFLLLLVAFRAPLVALKAGAMNLLSIGASYGVVTLVANGGWAGQLIGIDTATPVPPFIPVMMFAILFGLSMDYEVFLLSRIREEYLGGASTSGAVRAGLARTARVITAAAAIMVAVFGAFVLSPDVGLKLIGVGLATAILVDATIVRMVLAPAVMQILGERNWWLPRWLDRVIPRLEVEPAPAR